MLIKVFRNFELKTKMMEERQFFFNKPLQMVAIVAKSLQFLISLIFKSICC